jgi:hypothetical protein
MTHSVDRRFPKLRVVDVRPIAHNGQRFLLLRDPLKLTDKTLLVPQVLAPVLALCDGTREGAADLGIALELRFGLRIDRRTLDQMLETLDDALLLDNDRFEQATRQTLDDYRNAPFRQPALAGQSYPADPGELRALLDEYARSAGDADPSSPWSEGRGVISPHIDYNRGGPVYARVWKRAAEMVKLADLVVLFGTDHYGGDRTLTLTRQNYATPFGVLPTASDVVDAAAEALGEQSAFEGELRHRGEHSIELASVWLDYVRDGHPLEVVPVLCGSFSRFIHGDEDATTDASIVALLDALRAATAGRRVLVVAAADLAHVGPAFSGEPVDLAGSSRLKESDDELIDRMCAGDADGFLAAISNVLDRNNVCGVSAIYLALRLLGNATGEHVSYDRCPADEHGTSIVSVCGVVLR